MTKSTPDVSTCFVFKSSPEAFISPLFFSKFFYPGRGALLTLFGLHLGFLPSYAPGSQAETHLTWG